MPDGWPPQWIGLAVALGCGLLIGVERERRKGRGPDREAAGLRSFAIAACAGALAQTLPVAGLVLAGALLVLLLGVVTHFKSRAADPGLTTELALFTTYLIGVQSVIAPALGAACGVGLAVLLVARDRLHRFATRLLTAQELNDGLLLAALTLIALPLIPARSLDWLGGIPARPLFAMVLLILAVQAAGHVALRWLGPRRGAALSGFVSGFVSSTMTIAAGGAQARAHPRQAGLWSASGALSGVATWVQSLLMMTVLSPTAGAAWAPAALAGAAVSLAGAWALLRAAGAAPPTAQDPPAASALRPREAIVVALLLAVVAVGVGAARARFGEAGLHAGIALAALADAHAPVSALAALQAAGQIPTSVAVSGALTAIGANTLTRSVVAAVTGGPRYALRIAAVLLAGLAAAAAVVRLV